VCIYCGYRAIAGDVAPVTLAMIDAGVAAYRDEARPLVVESMVVGIYRAMIQARREPEAAGDKPYVPVRTKN
jgi:hypothetical protein